LGANGMHLMELVAAYATFPNQGVYRPPVFITKVTDAEGNVLEEYKRDHGQGTMDQGPKETDSEFNETLYEANKKFIESDQLKLSKKELQILYGKEIPPGHVMTPQTAYLMVKLMEGVVQEGTAQRVKKLGRPVAGKTGTTNDETDTWFVGYTPELAAGVWVGYDQVRSLGKGEQGGRTAAPIFLDFMQTAMKEKEIRPFDIPDALKGKEKDLMGLAGGSAKHAEKSKIPTYAAPDGGTSQDRSADFMGADLEGVQNTPPAIERSLDEEEGF
ncbi:MAG: penicillin-binding transpeptidase domain-containing protein, partial [bacterium]|nr:penicillin-binding transpeptidase domain-containing protein [bacterium]